MSPVPGGCGRVTGSGGLSHSELRKAWVRPPPGLALPRSLDKSRRIAGTVPRLPGLRGPAGLSMATGRTQSRAARLRLSDYCSVQAPAGWAERG
eukprot:754720-Hanusia_phi.AAC.1